MQKRLNVLDFIRVIAALSVILIHVTSTYVLENDIAYVINQSMRYAIPVFIILSGAALYYSDLKKEKISYYTFITKRINKVLLPYLLWTLIYMLYDLRHDTDAIFSKTFIYDFLNNLIFGKEHLYFIVIIFQIYLIYPFISLLFRKGYSKWVLIFSFILTFYFQLGVYLLRWYIYILPKSGSDYYYLLFPSWIFFFIFGMYFIKERERWEEKLSSFRINLTLIWFLSFIILLTDSKLSSTYGSSIKPTVMFYGLISFVFFYSLFISVSKIASNKTMNIVNWISAQSFAIYLSHILLLKLIRSYSDIIGLYNIWHGFEGMVLLFIANIIATFIFIYLIKVMPFSFLLGISGNNIKKEIKVALNIDSISANKKL